MIALFIHLQAGGGLPEHITKEEYDEVREAYRNKSGIFPAWYIGAVGFLASYKGRFFEGGYSGIRKTSGGIRNYYKESCNNILRQMQWMYDTAFVNMDYRDFTPHKSVIYCDPPYKGTKQYGSATFDYVEFWEIMRSWSKHNIVLISELQAPDDFTAIWEKEVVRSMKANERIRTTEKLFMWEG